MQISSYYKSKGHDVGFDIVNPDKVYISCIYRKNALKALIESWSYDCDVEIGGTGVNYKQLPIEIQKIKPDYDLYPSEHSLGFTTKGCIRNCPWCIVRKKEGYFKRHQHVKEFYDTKFDTVELLDNNILADKKWFFNNTDFLVNNKLKLIENGMDIRLIDVDIIQRLKELKCDTFHFAFDSMTDEKSVIDGIKLLKLNGINIRGKVFFYVLIGFNTTFEEDLYRIKLLRKLNTNAYAMPYNQIKTPLISDLIRYCNRKWIYWSCEPEEYIYGKYKMRINKRKVGDYF